MANEWKPIVLGDVLSFANGKTSPERSADLRNPVYGSNGVIGFASETNAPENTIVIGRVGSYCGSLYLSRQKCWVTDNAIRASALDDNDARFLFYLLRTLDLNHWRAGSGQPLLNQEILSQITASIPMLDEQRVIAHVLGTLDDKIELNRGMNETLEAMARALFKSWFVDFDPVRAKAEGRNSALPAHLADLFSDVFECSQLGEIPVGWEVKTISDLADVAGGSTPSTKEKSYWEGGTYNWATPKDLSRLAVPVLLETERKITHAALAQISSGLLPEGTVLLSSRAPIGYLAVAEIPVAINQGFIAMKPKKDVSNLFLLFWADWAHDSIVSQANGSTFLEISKGSFRPIPVLSPGRSIFDAFDAVVRPLYSRIVANDRESRTLSTLRDALLPKLVSGDLRVKYAETIRGNYI